MTHLSHQTGRGQQLDLWGSPVPPPPAPLPAHQSSSDTSREAAELIAPIAGTIDRRVIDVLRKAGRRGLTNYDLVDATIGVSLQSVCGAVCRLREKGLLVDTNFKRKSPSGRNATVRVAAEFHEDQDGGSVA